MTEVFLIIAAVVVALLMLFAVVLFVIIFGHPDDKNVAWFPRIVTIFGIWIGFVAVLILPYDVSANQSSGGDAVDVIVLWEIVYITLAILLSIIIPYAFFYYESEVDETEEIGLCDKQWFAALKYTLIFFIICIIALVAMYSKINTANIPVVKLAQSLQTVVPVNASLSMDVSNPVINVMTINQGNLQTERNNFPCFPGICIQTSFIWAIPVSFPLYIIAFLSFFGSFFFSLFTGVGLFALPMSLINAFRTRPVPMSTKTYFEERQKLGDRAKQLLELGSKLQAQQDKSTGSLLQRQRERQEMNAFEKQYFYLKKDYQMLHVAHELKGGNPLIPFAQLIFGILSICISISWLLHICIFMLPNTPPTQFLNSFFIELSIPEFPLFGVLAFAIWSFYLMWAAVKGNTQLGVRFLFWKLYPMEAGNTYMNAFLFNTFFILACSVPCVQFCIDAFPVYAAYTQANVMFGQQVKYLQFFSYFYVNNVFTWLLIAFCILTIIVMGAFPQNKAASVEAQLDALAKSSNTSLKDYKDEI